MREYGFSLARILPYKNKIDRYGRIWVSETFILLNIKFGNEINALITSLRWLMYRYITIEEKCT